MASGNGTLSNVHHSSMLLVGNMDLASESQWDTWATSDTFQMKEIAVLYKSTPIICRLFW